MRRSSGGGSVLESTMKFVGDSSENEGTMRVLRDESVEFGGTVRVLAGTDIKSGGDDELKNYGNELQHTPSVDFEDEEEEQEASLRRLNSF